MRVLFIVGPFRASTPWGVEQNIRRAEAVAFNVWMSGNAAICPHTNTRYFDKSADDDLWLEGAKAILARCDGVVTVEGWEASEGSLAEVALARTLGMPVYRGVLEIEQ